MRSFGEFLTEAGQEAGGMEIGNTSVEKAYAYGKKVYEKYGRDIDADLPDFKKDYLVAQKKAKTGKTVRKDMPVIDGPDVRAFQGRLKGGTLDINKPFGKVTKSTNPFPQGLSGEAAKKFEQAGLKKFDGDKDDDKVKVSNGKIEVGKLKPIQKQIYFDVSIDAQAEHGPKASMDFMQNKTYFIKSDDNFIIDGHHRFLSAMLMNPKLKVQYLSIDLPIKKLLPLSLAYGDAIGNKRNA
jgi:hypothetical protein